MTDLERVFDLVGKEIGFGKLRAYGMDYEKLDPETIIEVDRVLGEFALLNVIEEA